MATSYVNYYRCTNDSLNGSGGFADLRPLLRDCSPTSGHGATMSA